MSMLNYPPARESNRQSPAMPRSERKLISPQPSDTLKVPPADSPYGRAKHVQLVEKDPNRAISMFWAALNSGDRVESSLKDMALVMKQVNRSDEAIEAIKSFRHLCSVESQESLDNILLELYKRSGKIEEQIEMLEVKLKHIEEGLAFDGRRMKPARSNGKKIQITIEQEYSRMLGNLAWAYLQQDKYKSAEELYRKALSLEKDKNKQCNLAICLMYMERMIEAKFLLECVRSSGNGLMEETHAKSFGRASEILVELESQSCEETKKPFSSLIKRDVEEYPISGNLSEDKMTDANDHETVQQKRVSSCSWNGCKTSSSNVESSKCAPFGQRIGLQSSHKTSFAGKLKRGESYVRNYYEGRTGFGSKWNGNLERVAGGEMGYDTLSMNPAGGSPVVLFTQPRRGSPYSFGNAASGCNRKLTFAGNREQGRNSGWLESLRDEEYGTESGNCKELQSQCKPIKETLEARKHFSFDSSNKSWADMVAQAEYFDENPNCNIYFGSLLPQNQTESLSKKNGVLGFER